MIDTEKYQPARQNMKFVTLANKLHILARQADIFSINQLINIQITDTYMYTVLHIQNICQLVKASSCINKTLLLVKQQKWLSEFCVKMHRVASKN